MVNDGSYLELVNNGDIVFSNKEVYIKRTSDFNVISICQKLKMMKKPELVLIRDKTFCEIIPFRRNMNSTISDLKEAISIEIGLDPCYQVLVTKVHADESMAITDDYEFVTDLFFEKGNLNQSICLRLMVNTTQFTDEDL